MNRSTSYGVPALADRTRRSRLKAGLHTNLTFSTHELKVYKELEIKMGSAKVCPQLGVRSVPAELICGGACGGSCNLSLSNSMA